MNEEERNKLEAIHSAAAMIWYDLGRRASASKEEEVYNALHVATRHFDQGLELIEKVLYGEAIR